MNGLVPVPVCSGGPNKISQTGCLGNNRNLLLMVLEAGSLKSGWQHGQVLVRDLSRATAC